VGVVQQAVTMCLFCRVNIDKRVYGRNEYNDFYHWTARYLLKPNDDTALPPLLMKQNGGRCGL